MAKVQFARGFNEEQAKTSSNGDTIYFSEDTHSIVMGGEIYGGIAGDCNVSEEEAAYLAELYQQMLEAKFTVSATGASNKNPGDTVTLKVTVKWDGSAVDAGSATVTTDGLVWTEKTGSNGVFEAPYEIEGTGSKTIPVTVKYKTYTKTASITVSAYNLIVYGWAATETISSLDDILDKKTAGPASNSNGSYTFSNTEVGYYYIAIPDGTSVSTSLKKGYGTENDVTQVLFQECKGEDDNAVIAGYTVYRLQDAQAAGATHTVKFA